TRWPRDWSSDLCSSDLLKKLTTLRLHPGRDATIALAELEALLKSKRLPALTHLQVHMTTFGDEGAERIIQSGILRRLKVLDIGRSEERRVGKGVDHGGR